MKPLFVISCPIDTYSIRILVGQLFINKVWDVKQVTTYLVLIAQRRFINLNGNYAKPPGTSAAENVQAGAIVYF